MKIALLLSGQPRFVDGPGYASIKEKILDVYDCDVFCHFWWTKSGGTYITAPWSTLGDMPIPDNAETQIRELYNPKKMHYDKPLLESEVKTGYVRTSAPTTPYNLQSMYTSMQRSHRLMEKYVKETKTQYDFVIRLRYDAILTAFPDLTTLTNDRFYDIDYSKFHNLLANNGAIMSYPISKIFMNIIKYLDELYDQGIFFNDEHLVTGLILTKKIPFQILPNDQFYIDLYRGESKIGLPAAVQTL